MKAVCVNLYFLEKFSIMSPHIYSKPMSPVSRDQEVKMYQLTSGAKGIFIFQIN